MQSKILRNLVLVGLSQVTTAGACLLWSICGLVAMGVGISKWHYNDANYRSKRSQYTTMCRDPKIVLYKLRLFRRNFRGGIVGIVWIKKNKAMFPWLEFDVIDDGIIE